MIVTINTDASFSWHHRRGAYAFWIVSNEGKISHSGMLKSEVSIPEIAEFQCVLNALHVLDKAEWEGITKIIVNTDCLNIIHLVNNNQNAIYRYKLSEWGSPLAVKFRKIVSDKFPDVKVELRHVRSHISTETPRQWVNEWCDQEAKKHMNKFLNTL